MEEKIFQRQISKQGLNTVLDLDGCGNEGCAGLDAGRGRRKERKGSSKWEAKFSREELKDLFSLREDTLCDTHDLLQCGCGHGDHVTANDDRDNMKVTFFAFPISECALYRIVAVTDSWGGPADGVAALPTPSPPNLTLR